MYRPISCVFYDYIEHYATTGEEVEFVYRDEQLEEVTIRTVITDTEVKDKVEYVHLSTPPARLRMDRIVRIEGHELKGYC